MSENKRRGSRESVPAETAEIEDFEVVEAAEPDPIGAAIASLQPSELSEAVEPPLTSLANTSLANASLVATSLSETSRGETSPGETSPGETSPGETAFDYYHQVWSALAETQTVAARGFEAMVGELSTLTQSEIAAAATGATALLGAKTLADAVEIHLGMARRSFDAMIGSSAKLSEIGVKTATEAARPLLSQLSDGWRGLPFG